MTKFYDSKNKRLIYLSEEAEESYWDEHWDTDKLRNRITASPRTWLTHTTRRYLPAPAKILEGGCGLGNHVYALAQNGYQAVGVDFAPRTVGYLNAALPDLDIRLADVRRLPFDDNTFDGYWSLGVIEHFWDGYEEIALEISRVLRKGGYLFITFPWMSPLRRLKARFSCYPAAPENPAGFYQFALPAPSVIASFEYLGFRAVHKAGLDGLKGLKDEVGSLRPLLQRLYEAQSLPAKLVRKILNAAFSSSCGHIQLVVMQKL